MRRRPPNWPPHTDQIARECGIQTVTFTRPLRPLTLCHYCGGLADSRDHVVPDAVGGSREWWNLVPACIPCNVSKSDRQSCSCLFCLRAMALWSLGFRATTTRGEKRRRAASLRTT